MVFCSATMAQNRAKDSQLSKMYTWYINTGPTYNFKLSTKLSAHSLNKQVRDVPAAKAVQEGAGRINCHSTQRFYKQQTNTHPSDNAMKVNPSSCTSPPALAVYSLQQKWWNYKRTPSLPPAQPSVNWIASKEERKIQPENVHLAKLALADVWDIPTKQSHHGGCNCAWATGRGRKAGVSPKLGKLNLFAITLFFIEKKNVDIQFVLNHLSGQTRGRWTAWLVRPRVL